jgi:hypothetical protein
VGDEFPDQKKSGSVSEWHSKVNDPGISVVNVPGRWECRALVHHYSGVKHDGSARLKLSDRICNRYEWAKRPEVLG